MYLYIIKLNNMKSKCKLTSPNLAACELPEINIKEHRKKIKSYLKSFNAQIKKAIADDELILKISIKDDYCVSMFDYESIHIHSISFEDKKLLKF